MSGAFKKPALSRGFTALLVLFWGWAGADGPALANGEAPKPPREVRAIWVARWEYLTGEDVRNLVANCAAVGLNRIYFQVRGRGDAFYKSSFEPWGEELKGDPARDGDPGFDPLKTALDAARQRQVQLFAWVNVLPGWKGARPPRSKKHLVHTHPEWFLLTRGRRRLLLDEDSYTLLNPCLPEVRGYLADVIGDLVSRYAVDGIQLDYIRFLGRPANPGEDVPYDAATLSRFRQSTGGFPARYPEAWNQFRRDALHQLVSDLAARLRKCRPQAILSVTAVQDLDLAREQYFQEVSHWVEQGWVQEVCPMSYAPGLQEFQLSLSRILARIPEAKLVPGIGFYQLPGRNEAAAQISIARGIAAQGYAIFCYSSCFESCSPYAEAGDPARKKRQELRRLVSEANDQTAKAR